MGMVFKSFLLSGMVAIILCMINCGPGNTSIGERGSSSTVVAIEFESTIDTTGTKRHGETSVDTIKPLPPIFYHPVNSR